MNDQPTPPSEGEHSSPSRPAGQGSAAKATERIHLVIEAAEQAASGIIDDAEAQARKYLEESRVRAEEIASQRAREMSGLTDELIGYAEALKRQSDDLLRVLDQAKRRIDETLHVESPSQQASPTPPAPSFSQEAPPPQPPSQQPPPPPVQPVPPPVSEPPPVHHLKPVEPAPSFSPPPAQAPPLPPQPPAPPPAWPPSQPQAPATPNTAPEAPTPFPASQPPSDFAPPAVPPSAPVPSPRTASSPPSDGARLLATQMAVAGSSRAEIEGRLQNEFGIRETGPMLDAILGREQ